MLHIEYQKYRQMHKPRANKALWRESRPDYIMMEKEALAARIQERTSVFCSRRSKKGSNQPPSPSECWDALMVTDVRKVYQQN